MESRWQGRPLWIAKTSQDPTVFASLKTQATGFTKAAKLTMKAKEGSYLEAQELGMEICYQLRERNLFCATSGAGWEFSTNAFWRKS